MVKIIAVHGATGMQGGSAVKSLLKSEWKVRAITRNAAGDSAKSLLDAGAEVGVEAIFLVTNFWEHLYAGKTAVQSGEAEAAQAMNVVKIADKLPGLKHFIWSTLPGNVEGKPKRTVVQHFDFKAQVDVNIRKDYPNLAAKTTFLYVGFYANNLANFPAAKLFSTAFSHGTYFWMTPVSRKAIIPSTGDVTVNIGVFVKAILAQPSKTIGKYAAVVTDTISHDEMMKYWMEATGKKAAFLQVVKDDWIKAFGEPGEEIWGNMKAFEENPRWAFDNDPLSGKDLGIEEELVGTRDCFLSLKEKLL